MPKHKVHPDDISGRMFRDALDSAYQRVGSKKSRLADALGMNSRVCIQWLSGHFPPYAKMQKVYYKLVAIAADYSEIDDQILLARTKSKLVPYSQASHPRKTSEIKP